MTVEEFNQSASEYQRRILAVIGLAAFACFGCFAISLWIFDVLGQQAIKALYVKYLGNIGSEILLGLTPLPAVLILFACIWYGERRVSADPRIRCPHCDKVLAPMRHLVVATRNCPFCGRKVLQEPLQQD